MGSDVRHVRGEAQKELVRKFEVFSSKGRSRWQVWSDWITVSAIAVSNATDQSHFEEREKQYLSIAGKYTRPEMEAFTEMFALLVVALEENSNQDFLGELYMCLGLGNEHAPISIGEEKSKKVRFGSVYDGLYVTDAQRQAKAELDAITLTSQSSQECLECPVSAGCGWCSGLNYEMYGTANKRFTGICWAHKARVLASAYYHNRRYLEIGDCLPIKAALPEADAQKILPLQEYDEFLLIERKALAKFADAAGIS